MTDGDVAETFEQLLRQLTEARAAMAALLSDALCTGDTETEDRVTRALDDARPLIVRAHELRDAWEASDVGRILADLPPGTARSAYAQRRIGRRRHGVGTPKAAYRIPILTVVAQL